MVVSIYFQMGVGLKFQPADDPEGLGLYDEVVSDISVLFHWADGTQRAAADSRARKWIETRTSLQTWHDDPMPCATAISHHLEIGVMIRTLCRSARRIYELSGADGLRRQAEGPLCAP